MTNKGTPCRLFLSSGKCPTHDVDISARNSRVQLAARARNPEAYRSTHSAAGKRGFIATGGVVGWERANERARAWRLAHPSEPERWAMTLLAVFGGNNFEREYPVLDGSALDFACPATRMGIEINGHQAKQSFGEATSRAGRHAAKIADLTAVGWEVLVLDVVGRCDRSQAAQQLIQFCQRCTKRLADTASTRMPGSAEDLSYLPY